MNAQLQGRPTHLAPLERRGPGFTTRLLLQTLEGALLSVAILIVVGVIAGASLPLIAEERTALLVVAALGLAMCGFGMYRSVAARGWRHPLNLVGSALGALVILLVASTLTGMLSAASPPSAISGERLALLIIIGVISLKWVISLGESLTS
jgi:hypothetical protein